jgi:hypothetical protein
MFKRLSTFFNYITEVRYPYNDVLDQNKARGLLWMVFGVLFIDLLALIVLVPIIASGTNDIWQQTYEQTLIATPFLLIGIAIEYWLIQTGRLSLAAYFFILILQLDAMYLAFSHGLQSAMIIAFSTPVIASGLLFNIQGAFANVAIATSIIVVMTLLQTSGTLTVTQITLEEEAPSLIFDIAITLLINAGLLAAFSGQLGITAQKLNKERRKWRGTSELVGTALRAAGTAKMYQDLAAHIRDTFNFYHVQFYEPDPGARQVLLRAGTGLAGRELLDRNHKITLNTFSAVSRAATQKEAVLERLGSDAFDAQDILPAAKAQIAIPLMQGENLISILNVYTADDDGFQRGDRERLQMIAHTISYAIVLVSELNTTRATLQTYTQALNRSQSRLEEAEAANRQLIGEAWRDHLQASDLLNLQLKWDGGGIAPRTEWTSMMESAYQRGAIQEDARTIAAPLVMRGEVIGALEFTLPEGQWDESRRQFVTEVVNRLILMMENIRLLEETRRQAQQQSAVAQMSEQLQRTQDIDQMIAWAVEEFKRLLGANRARLRVGLDVLNVEERAGVEPDKEREVL